MKTYLSHKFPLLLLLLSLCLPLSNGCTTFKAAAVVATTVDGAMNGWGEYVRAGRATPAQEAIVRDAYEKYQKSMLVVEAIVKEPASQQGQLEVAIGAVSASKNAIIDVINAFIPPAKK